MDKNNERVVLVYTTHPSVVEAERIGRYLTEANLVGHDSHGVILIPSYVERIKVGHIVPGAPFKMSETPLDASAAPLLGEANSEIAAFAEGGVK